MIINIKLTHTFILKSTLFLEKSALFSKKSALFHCFLRKIGVRLLIRRLQALSQSSAGVVAVVCRRCRSRLQALSQSSAGVVAQWRRGLVERGHCVNCTKVDDGQIQSAPHDCSNRSKSFHNVASNHFFLFLFSAADSLEDRQQIRDRYPFKENTRVGRREGGRLCQ